MILKVSWFPYFIKFNFYCMRMLFSRCFPDINSYLLSFATYGCCHTCLLLLTSFVQFKKKTVTVLKLCYSWMLLSLCVSTRVCNSDPGSRIRPILDSKSGIRFLIADSGFLFGRLKLASWVFFFQLLLFEGKDFHHYI